MATRVLLADDHEMFREGLRALLNRQAGLEVAGEAINGRQAVSMAQELTPDVVVIDIAMPDMNGVEATGRLTAAAPRTAVIALSVYTDQLTVTRMLDAGASGYVPKLSAFTELVVAIRAVSRGEVYISPRVADEVARNRMRFETVREGKMAPELTPREREVLQLIAEGCASKEIARRLHISDKTVGNHRQSIMDKLDLHNVAELTRYAIREGVAPLDSEGQKPGDGGK